MMDNFIPETSSQLVVSKSPVMALGNITLFIRFPHDVEQTVQKLFLKFMLLRFLKYFGTHHQLKTEDELNPKYNVQEPFEN